MSDTPRLHLPYIAASQYQKEVTHSVGLDRLDLLVQCAVLDRNLTAPPASPTEGDAYIIGPAPTGAWTDHANELALWVSSQWQLIPPGVGWLCWVIDEAVLVVWDGSVWSLMTSGSGGTTITGEYRWTTSTAGAPTSGHVGVDNSAYPAATTVHIHKTSDSGMDGSNALLGLVAGDELLIRDGHDPNISLRYRLSAAGTDNGTWMAFAVTWLIGNGTLSNNAPVNVLLIRAASQGTLLALTDTPDSYSGQAGKTLLVNAGETGMEFGTTAGSAPVDAPYVVTATHATLSAERVVTDNTQIAWDTATAGQLKATIAPEGVSLDKLAHQPQGTLLGRGDTLAPTDEVQVLTVGPGLTLSGTTLSASGGVTDFLALTDTPDAYTGQGGKVVAVNAGATALEFVTGAGGGASAALGAEVQRVATQSIAASTNVAVSFDTEIRDDAGYFTLSAPTRLTLPTTGWYTITGSVQWDSASSGQRIINVRVNGAQYIAVETVPVAGTDQRQNIATNWYLTAGDYIEIVVFHNTVSSRTLTALATLVGMTAAPEPATTFLALTDTPDSYSGQASKLVGVNAAATGVAFAPLVVDASGNLGVGTATPTQRLHVQDGPALISASTGGMVIIDGPATAFRVLKMSSSGVDRWILRAQNDPETGGNVGSNLAVRRYADDGTFLAAGNILWLERGSGNIGLLGQITFGTGAQNVLGLRTVATAPTTSPADAVQLWGGDRGGVAGKGSLYLRTEDSTSHVLGDLVGLGTLCAATLGSGASYQALNVRGSTLYVGQSSVQERAMGGVSTSWVVSTDATRTARLTVSAYDATAAREGLRVEADGSASRLSFHGVAAVVRQTVPAAATDATTTQALVNAVRTALVNYGLCV